MFIFPVAHVGAISHISVFPAHPVPGGGDDDDDDDANPLVILCVCMCVCMCVRSCDVEAFLVLT
jgi:hypothetical protein